uniref:TOG array regulator of axonemal microtubules protein 1-like isoform X2 n=1 Tax=Scatophagus argus TaxID=75038 RepID=UPI001ED85C26|nr:TOG array regulator of axonemal microtubules protein 1-like isoform X2 [Scatophagus argus]
MDNQETSSIFHRFWQRSRSECEDASQTGSQCRQENPVGFTSESRILDIERAKRAERAALMQHAERLCASVKARNDAVLERLGLFAKHATLPSAQPPAFPRRQAPSLRGRRLSPLSDASHFSVECINKNQQSSESSDEEEDDSSSCDLMLLSSEQAQVGDRESPAASIRSWSSLSSVDTHTPSDLRAIPLIASSVQVATFTPAPPQAVLRSRSKVSRLPLLSTRLNGAVKEVADGCRRQSGKDKVEVSAEGPKRIQLNTVPSPQPPAAAKRTPVETLLAPSPPTAPQTKRKGSRPGMILRPAKVISKAEARDCCFQPAKDKKVDLQPLNNPVESLSLSFKLLSSDDWMKKTEGLKTIRALAQHHSDILKTQLHQVCLVLIEEVKNLRSAVACAAVSTLAELYVHLQTAMDPEAEGTGRALLLKLAQTTNEFIHQQVNLALDALVQNCSHGRTVSALLNTGLSHRCAAIRGSTAQHLHLLTDKFGAAHMLKAGRSFTERFLTAVSKMSVDAAPEVRHHGQIILHELARHKDFLHLWTKIIPENERRQLAKIIKKAK